MDKKINLLISLYWDNKISREDMITSLKDVSQEDLVEWIDNIVNHVPEAMNFATHGYRTNNE